jgi:predicted metal-binding membrane protein
VGCSLDGPAGRPEQLSTLVDRLGLSPAGPARAAAVWAALLATAAVAWILTVRDAVAMGNGPGTMGRDLLGFVLLWTVMMAAMMLPSVAPVSSLYLSTLRDSSRGLARASRVTALVAGYLAAWAAFGVLGFAAAWGGGRVAAEFPGGAPWVGAGILVVAGLYQLTPLKNRCLAHCRSPLGFLLRFGGYSGRLRDLRAGAYHGGYCGGCCWGLMAVLVAVGVMNLAWMAGLAAVIFLEKNWRHGKTLGIAFGLALVVVACFVPAHPGLAPGLHHTGGMSM